MKDISSTGFQQLVTYKGAGTEKKIVCSFFRGKTGVQFNPYKRDYDNNLFLKNYILKGQLPELPPITQNTQITAFGSCFARNISNHLAKRKFNMTSASSPEIYISYMGEGMVNVHAIAQQFEQALEDKKIPDGLWHGWKAEDYGVSEDVRLKTKDAFLETEFFIITLRLSEVWEDTVTGEVFWRAVPLKNYDESRHKFRILTMEEIKLKLEKIYSLIRYHIPKAQVLFTLSPVPLAATFRDILCITANSVSKSILRASLDEFLRDKAIEKGINLFYFLSFEIISKLFYEKFMDDGRHPKPEIIELIITMFEGGFCNSEIDWHQVEQSFKELRKKNLIDILAESQQPKAAIVIL